MKNLKLPIFFTLAILLALAPLNIIYADIPYSSEALKELSIDELKQLKENVEAMIKQKETEDSFTLVSNTIIDDENLRVEFLGFEENPYVESFNVKLHITNKAKKTITLSMSDASVDKTTMQLIMTGVPVTIRPEEEGYGSFIFTYIQAGINSFDDFSQVSFKLDILDENWEIFASTERVTVDKSFKVQ